MLKEYPGHGRAVVAGSEGNVLWQLVKFCHKNGKTRFAQGAGRFALTYPTKSVAEKYCKHMGFQKWHVERGFYFFPFWFIRYDPRYDYALAAWEV